MFRRLFWIMLAVGVPVVALSPMFAMILGYQLPDVPLVGWVSPVLGTLMYVWGGRPFLTGAVSEIRARQPGMMLLIGLAITVAFVASWGATLGLLDHALDFWWELALLVVIMLLGHWIEMRSLAASASALDSLAALLPDSAELVDGDRLRTVRPVDLVVDDLVVVRPGGRVPADGEVVDGTADVDESMITGESRPVSRGVGDRVVAGTIATDSSVRVRVTATGDDTALAGIARLVSEAQSSSSRAQLLADRAAGWLFWFALGSAVVTAVVWTLLGQPDDALVRTITVLVIACPHALGLAIPLVVSIATERAARAGVLITDRSALEAMRTVDTVLFDKTGTLTRGEPVLVGIALSHPSEIHKPATDRPTADQVDENTALSWAAAAERQSEHPLARAIVGAAEQRGLPLPVATEIATAPGVGVSARVEGRLVRVGGPAMLAERGLQALPGGQDWSDNGSTVLHVVVDERIVAALALADEVRPESREAVAALQRRGVSVVMITGDAAPVAASVGAALGIDRVLRRRTSGGQGRRGRSAAAYGRSGRHGRGRRQRRPRPGPGRRRAGHRCRHRRGDRLGRRRARRRRPSRRAVGDRALAPRLRQDASEPGLGRGLQPDSRPVGRGDPGSRGFRAPDGGRSAADVGVDGGGGAQRAAAAPAGPGPGPPGPRLIRPTRP